MLREAFGFPRNRNGAARELVVGGVLVLTAPLVLPALLLAGYLLRVMDAAARGRDVPPAFGGWGGLLVDGLKSVVVVLVWGVLPVALLVAGSALAAAYVLPLSSAGPVRAVDLATVTAPQLAVLGTVVLALGLLAFVCLLHLPAALVALATQGRLRAAFRTGALWAVATTRQYVAGVFVALLVYAVGGTLAGFLTPVVVGFVLVFYVQVAVAYLLGRAVGGAAVTAIKPVA